MRQDSLDALQIYLKNWKHCLETTVYLKQHKALLVMEQWFQPLGFMSMQSWDDNRAMVVLPQFQFQSAEVLATSLNPTL